MRKLLKQKFDFWNNINEMDDKKVIKKIENDNIDILIDLSGHTAHNRLSIFVNRIAPIQMTWLGYNATTGLREIDYIIVDPHVISKNGKDFFSEKLLFMPNTFQNINFFENGKIKNNRKKNKGIIFGSFNRYAKINDDVIKIWSEILLKNTKAKLYLKSKEFSDEFFKEKILKKFFVNQVDKNQIILDGNNYNRKQFLNLFNKIDIMLDPFPYGGVTTSLEGLWMGVPLLTLVGEKYYSRIGYSINKNLNLDDWCTFDKKEYVNKALEKSKNYNELIHLKKNLRNKLKNSPIFDTKNFARDFENILLKVYIQLY